MRFSVIAPVYGVEKYLDTFVKSVLSQTYTDFELILVDDMSPDSCPAMCDAYAAQDSRVRVIHKTQNEGLGFARNTGIASALGDYILFADSDDYIEPTLLEECDRELENAPDILVFGVNFCYESKSGAVSRTETAVPSKGSASTPQGKAQIFAMLNRSRVFQYAWNKLYRRDFLTDSDVLFEKTPLIEDFLFNIAVFEKAGHIMTVDKAYYNYRKPQHETLASRYSPEFFELCKRKYSLERQFVSECGCLEEHLPLIQEMYIKHFVSCILRNRSKAAGLSKKEQKNLIRSMCTDPVTVEVVNCYHPTDTVYNVICKEIRNSRAAALLTLCCCIDFVQKRLMSVFRKLLKKQ